ncbi:MAG: sigma-70 family RNA polymerase sigma factor [Actinobacteria bacterium]|nr:MAG: sigma-70 family RNA polymerase sigma factor [Actinomycetota bacterium]
MIYCIAPRDLAAKAERAMRRYAGEHQVEVVAERRRRDRRATGERRNKPWPAKDPLCMVPACERRRIRHLPGRRVTERRATLVPVAPPAVLPRAARLLQDDLVFAERLEPGLDFLEDADTGRMVTRWQAGERELFADIYRRYFDRVYAYLRMVLADSHEAEDATQQVFLQAMEALPRYELRAVPFRAWLFRIVRNYSIKHLAKHSRVEVEDPDELDRRRGAGEESQSAEMPAWLTDEDLLFLVGRLTLVQRQVILLRFMMGLSAPEVAEVLGRSPEAVRQLQQRALSFLRERLIALGHRPEVAPVRVPMRQAPCYARLLRAPRPALPLAA